MPHVITQSCCNDASCVYTCPVNCIGPTPDDPAFLTVEMLHIDPETCVDCGACVSACPVDAIRPELALTESERRFAQINAQYHRGWPGGHPRAPLAPVVPRLRVRSDLRAPDVAIVGSGPAGMYVADELLTIPGARATVYERLREPYGLARFGVAPDHRRTRNVARQFDQIADQRGFRLHTGVEVGRDVTEAELLARHDAVVYATGAATDRPFEVPGAELPHVASATEFVAWYNGHPDQLGRSFPLDHERVVLIGNGNVALDVARMLTLDPAALEGTVMNPDALAALRASRVREVQVVGRRGPEHTAFTLPEIAGLAGMPGVDVVADLAGHRLEERDPKVQLLQELRTDHHLGRRIVLRWGLRPTQITPDAVQFADETVPAGLVLSAIGYASQPAAHDGGRLRARVYVAGWIKRGPSGFIGTNKACAQETVRSIVEDHNAGRLGVRAPVSPRGSRRSRPRRRSRAPSA